jgi:hypothetical protein
MIQNFDLLKQQLSELSPIINSFKSETVQLRVIELVFAQAVGVRSAAQTPDVVSLPIAATKPRRRKTARAKTGPSEKADARPTRSKAGRASRQMMLSSTAVMTKSLPTMAPRYPSLSLVQSRAKN